MAAVKTVSSVNIESCVNRVKSVVLMLQASKAVPMMSPAIAPGI